MRIKENKWLYISMAFSCSLLLVRMAMMHSLTYIFFGWNLFLAWIPFLLSNYLVQQPKQKIKQYLILFTWLVFFPNAPYIITDMFHFEERLPVPFYYDLVLCFSFAWNGLLLGLISLFNVEKWAAINWGNKKAAVIVCVSLFLCGFGIYLGRYLRWNSWDILINPLDLTKEIIVRVIYPFEHIRTWSVTVLFTSLLTIIYFNIKKLAQAKA